LEREDLKETEAKTNGAFQMESKRRCRRSIQQKKNDVPLDMELRKPILAAIPNSK